MLICIFNSIKHANDTLINMDAAPKEGDAEYDLLVEAVNCARPGFWVDFQPPTIPDCITMAKHFQILALEALIEELGNDEIDADTTQLKYSQQLGYVGFGRKLVQLELYGLYSVRMRNGQALPSLRALDFDKEDMDGAYDSRDTSTQKHR
ncbi:hypothetical protein NX059_001869 [Plenodomus lindquistii]|nr:hypothetical protein NX059_001869 [Plenodomus lindquistii]